MQTLMTCSKFMLAIMVLLIIWTIFYQADITNTKKEEKNIDIFRRTVTDMKKNIIQSRPTILNVTDIKFPSKYDILPHLSNNPNSLKTAFQLNKNKSFVSIVLGIPTVKRNVQTYLFVTLKNLLNNMTPAEAADTLIIVMVAESDLAYVTSLAQEIEALFPDVVKNGLLDVISPSPHYYPDFTKIENTLGDDHERVVWRSKQTLDFAFLMSYGYSRGLFYIQLEDDILAKNNFITTIKAFIVKCNNENKNWVVLEFSGLGFIGKLFKSKDLPRLIEYFLLFYIHQPVDWLLDLFLTTEVCPHGGGNDCIKAKSKLWKHHRPSLFQHVGKHSSLKGKVQDLKDKEFGTLKLYYAHNNTKAFVETNIAHYDKYFLEKAYRGESFFWGLAPKHGDFVKFEFEQPIFIKKFLFTSGNAEHPGDKFSNTTVEILPEILDDISNNSSNYIIIGQFDNYGVAQGTVDEKYGKISELRLFVHSDSINWVILSEIQIVADLIV